ncbi:hypothetical protein [Nocardioides sp.]|uniref:hypothetical protein n=1 Tax=Nocardioides sp. TaxID=35761 RepID=UPI00260F84F1|nr:hypothetical protein [Nocardioides sp.]MDI6912204.1 hypothetical protein [Nocardioides sp.]
MTISPGSTYAGLSEVPALRRDGDGDLLAGGRATWVSNEEAYAWVRDVAERDVMVLLAGKEAEDLALRLHRCRLLLTAGVTASVPRVNAVDRAIVESAPASSADAEEFAAGDAARKLLPKRDRTDEARAWRGVLELNPGRDPKVCAAHLAFLRADVRAHLESQWPAVEALAGALLEHTTLSGTAATRIIGRHLT